MNGLRTWGRRLRTVAWTALTLVILLAAVVVGVGKLLMPYSQRYQPQLEAWLARELGQPVSIRSFTGEWKAFGPRISIEGLELAGAADGSGRQAIERAALDIKPLNALLSGRPLYSFRVIGVDLALVRGADGQFTVSGLGFNAREAGGGGEEGIGSLARLGEVVLEQGRLSYVDEQRQVHLRLVNVNGRLRMDDRDLALQVEAGVGADDGTRVLGDLGATLVAHLDRDQRLDRLQWHVETGELSLSELAGQWPDQRLAPASGWLNAQAWGAWQRGEPQRMEGVLDIRDAGLDTASGPLHLDHLNSRFRWRFADRQAWRLDLADLRLREGGRDWTSPRLSIERNLPGGLGIWVSADFLEVEFPLALTQHLMGLFKARWPGNVPRAGKGQVRDFNILIDADRQFAGVSGEFEQVAASDWGRWPAVAGLSGSLVLMGGEGDIRFSGQGVRIDWEGQFRAPATVDVPGCHIEVLWSRTDWQVDAQACTVVHPAIRLEGRSRFANRRGGESKPRVDINVAVSQARIAQLHDYWPQRLVKPRVEDWLRRALQGGTLRRGRFLLSGDLDDFPFRGGQGVLDAVLQVDDATIAFHPAWPAARGVDAEVRFNGPGMTAHGGIDDVGGAPVEQARARIADFKAARLELDWSSGTELPRLLGFLRATPLLADTRLPLDDWRVEGQASVKGTLGVPLGDTPGALAVEGTLRLPGNRFAIPGAEFALDAIEGRIRFDREGFRGEGLDVRLEERPGTLDLEADWDATTPFTATLAGRFPVSALTGRTALRDDPLLALATGESEWTARLAVSREREDAAAETWLYLESALAGIALDLPAPLDKPADAAWPLQVAFPVSAAQPEFRLELPGRAALRVATAGGLGEPRSAALRLGEGMPALPADGQFTVSGHAGRLDMDGWVDVVAEYFGAGRVSGRLAFESASVLADELLLLRRPFAQVQLTAGYHDQVLSAQFEGEALAGSVRYHRTPGQAHSLAADFDRLYLPVALDPAGTAQTDPARLPELHLYVRDFRFHELALGETRIEAFPQGTGLRFESVEAITPEMTFQARGDWLVVDGQHRSDFDVVLTAESLGALVRAMQLSSVLEGGQTMVRYDAWWPGPPASFALAVLNGQIEFSVIDGRILNADPGAGRVLGLISVAALPRRLALDFRDVFASGFGFDRAHGTIQLENGTARTQDFVLESTAATLSVSGASDLVAQTFDYEMSVRPGVSQALPVIGAIAGGPGGAAAGLALQGLLRKALGDATEARYRITGPWSQPEVLRLEVVPQATPNAKSSQEPGQ